MQQLEGSCLNDQAADGDCDAELSPVELANDAVQRKHNCSSNDTRGEKSDKDEDVRLVGAWIGELEREEHDYCLDDDQSDIRLKQSFQR